MALQLNKNSLSFIKDNITSVTINDTVATNSVCSLSQLSGNTFKNNMISFDSSIYLEYAGNLTIGKEIGIKYGEIISSSFILFIYDNIITSLNIQIQLIATIFLDYNNTEIAIENNKVMIDPPFSLSYDTNLLYITPIDTINMIGIYTNNCNIQVEIIDTDTSKIKRNILL